jgi:hypothetical protein
MSSDNAKDGLSINLGKETGAAVGEVIRNLLSSPAKEAGDLLADGIGILGDKIRQKRELNAQAGLDSVRKKLDAAGVAIEDVEPPKLEEMHQLVNGLSLVDDTSLRELWAGLFTKALEPQSGITPERPFLSILDSLSPLDAKIIHFIAFVDEQEKLHSRHIKKPKIKDIKKRVR